MRFMDDENAIQKSIAARLISALKQGEFVLYGQPIVPLAPASGERPFQEILIRFREEEAKLLPPGSFFPLLEEYRLLPYVDRWMVSWLSSWAQASRANKPDWLAPRNGINLAADTLLDPTFADFTSKHIRNAGLPDESFVFEIAWDTALARTGKLGELRAQLKPAGCRFSLADFDGSEVSFNFLKEVAPDFVKLGYDVLKDIDRALAASERAESINRKCHSMGIRTIAEYVESRDVLEQLRAIEVDFAQGLEIGPAQRLA